MRWKKQVNDLLLRSTGYRLTRRPPPAPPTEQSRARVKEPEPPKAKAPRPPEPTQKTLPKDMDEEARRIIRRVRPRTMTSPDKLFGLIASVRYVVRHQIPGDIVECGVWRGGSMQAAALALIGEGVTDRDLYLFDTFEGMPPPTKEDRRQDGRLAADLLATSDRSAWVWAIAPIDDVKQAMAEVDYPAKRVTYVQGLVEDTVPEQAPDTISILRLDTDWYESTRHELTHLYPRLSPGGVLIIDDYGWWQGSRKATEEFLEESGARLLLLRLGDGRVAVKP